MGTDVPCSIRLDAYLSFCSVWADFAGAESASEEG